MPKGPLGFERDENLLRKVEGTAQSLGLFPISRGPSMLLAAGESETWFQASVFHSVTMCTFVYGCPVC